MSTPGRGVVGNSNSRSGPANFWAKEKQTTHQRDCYQKSIENRSHL